MSLNLQKSTVNELLYVGFNQDFGCFAVGTDTGFRIYNCEPFKETFRRDFSSGGIGSGGIGMVEMLFRCNILALVGGGRNPRYPPHKVMIWDDHQNRCIGELSFRSEVKAVRLRRDRVVVALNNRVYIYNFADLTLVDHVETADNPRGLCAVCPSPTNNVLACPGTRVGSVRVELYDQRKTTLIQAHEAALACMALSASGCRLATASEKGTLLRVYDTSTGELLQEVRRGADKADIYSLAFSANATLLACTSDKGTVHIFKLREAVWESSGSGSSSSGAGAGAGAGASGNTTTGTSGAGTGPSSSGAAANSSGASGDRAGNGGSGAGGAGASAAAPGTSSSAARGGVAAASGSSTGGAPGSSTGGGGVPPAAAASSAAAEGDAAHAGGAGGAGGGSGGFAFMKQILPKYFTSEWSYAQFRVPDTKSICAFGHEPNSILVVGADGSFFKANFEKGGEATRIAYATFARSGSGVTGGGGAGGSGSGGTGGVTGAGGLLVSGAGGGGGRAEGVSVGGT